METLTAKQATLLRDIINHWVETTAEEDQIAVIRESLGLPSVETTVEEALPDDFEEVVETWHEAYETLNAIATGGR